MKTPTQAITKRIVILFSLFTLAFSMAKGQQAGSTISITASAYTICSGNTTTLVGNGSVNYLWSNGATTDTIIVSPDTTTTYSVTGVNDSGIADTATLIIVVNPSPIVTITASATTICSGSSVTLSDGVSCRVCSPTYTYLWSDGETTESITISPASSTAYYVTATNSNGCSGNASQVVTVNPGVIVTITPSATSICSGGSVTLSDARMISSGGGGTPTYTYLWNDGETTEDITVSPTSTTTYSVTATNGFGCSGSASQLITVNNCGGSSCANAISLSTGNCSNPISLSNLNTWFTYTASANTDLITIHNPADMAPGRVMRLVIYSGTCSNLDSIGGGSFDIGDGEDSLILCRVANLTMGNTYYVKAVADNIEPLRTFTICDNPFSISDRCTNNPCDLVNNGDFERMNLIGSCPVAYSNIIQATQGYSDVSCWYSPIPTTPDYFNACSGSSAEVGVPTNEYGCTPAHSGNGYAGIFAYTLNGSGYYREYLQENLNTVMTAGVTYNVSFWVQLSTASYLSVDPLSMGIYITNGQPTAYDVGGYGELFDINNPGNPISLPSPQVITATSSTGFNGSGWVQISGTYKSTGGENWITIGNFSASTITSTSTLTPVCFWPGGANMASGNNAYYFVDDVSIPNPLVITGSASPTMICPGGSSVLTASGGAPGTTYTWTSSTGSVSTGAMITVTPTSTTTYTLSAQNTGCPNTNTVTITVTVVPLPTVTVSPSNADLCEGSGPITLTASGAVSYTWTPSSGAVNPSTGSIVMATPTVTTFYTVKGTNAQGCSSTATATVTVNPVTPVTVTPSNTTMCANSFVNLNTTGTGITTYSWAPIAGLNCSSCANPTATPTATTVYTLTATNASGCSSTATATVNVNSIQINGPTTVCSGVIGYCPGPATLTGPDSSVDKNRAATHACDYILTYTADMLGCNSTQTVHWGNILFNGKGATSSVSGNTLTVTVPFTDAADFDDGFGISCTVCCGGECCSENFQIYGCCANTMNCGNSSINCCTMNAPTASNNISVSLATMNLAGINTGPSTGGVPNFNKPGNTGFNSVLDSNGVWYFEDFVSAGKSHCSTLTINGVLNISQSLTIRNSEIEMGPGAQIILSNGATLTIDNSHIHACSTMWQGITVPNGCSIIVTFGSLIEDAELAILSNNGGLYTIKNSTLNKNYEGIRVESYSGTYTGTIQTSQISCNTITGKVPPYNGQFQVTLGSDAYLIQPHSTISGGYGIVVSGVQSIQIGVTSGIPNVFDNLGEGIDVLNNSSTTIYNNTFENFSSCCSLNTAIFGEGSLATTTTLQLTVGGSGAKQANSFTNCTMGVETTNNINTTVLNNSFSGSTGTIKPIAVYMFNNKNIKANISDNAPVSGFYEGVLAVNNTNSRITINSNTITGSSLWSGIKNSPSTGIEIQETPVTTTSYTVAANHISAVDNGIFTENLWGKPNILSNVITIDWLGNGATANEGIYASNSQNAYIDNNTINGPKPAHTTGEGIRLDAGSSGNAVLCNYINHMATDLAFESPTVLNTLVDNNQMDDYSVGLYLFNKSDIGIQGTPGGHGSANQWKTPPGSFTCYCNTLSGAGTQIWVTTLGAPNTYPYFPPITTEGAINSSIKIPFKMAASGDCDVCSGVIPINCGIPVHAADAIGIINNSTTYTTDAQATYWHKKHSLYKYLTQTDSTLLDSSNDIRNFVDSVAKANMGSLEQINTILSDSNGLSPADLAAANTISVSLVNPDAVEYTAQTVYKIILSLDAGSGIPDANQVNTLENIAPLCPAEYGYGVYMARAILRLVSDVQYVNNCEVFPSVNNEAESNRKAYEKNNAINTASVYPNPANTILNVSVDITQIPTPTICIYNAMGEQVKCEELVSNITTLPTNELAQGIYYYRITDISGALIKADKIVIVH